MSAKTDAKFGRRGGNWLPDDYRATDFAGAPRCDVCGGPMVVGQKRRHHTCDPESIVGERCGCRPDCTRELVGDGPAECDPTCAPCRIYRNRRHKDVPEWSRWK